MTYTAGKIQNAADLKQCREFYSNSVEGSLSMNIQTQFLIFNINHFLSMAVRHIEFKAKKLKHHQWGKNQQEITKRYFNPFAPNVPFLYPLKTSENLTVFWYFQGVEKGCIGNKWVKVSVEPIYCAIYKPFVKEKPDVLFKTFEITEGSCTINF